MSLRKVAHSFSYISLSLCGTVVVSICKDYINQSKIEAPGRGLVKKVCNLDKEQSFSYDRIAVLILTLSGGYILCLGGPSVALSQAEKMALRVYEKRGNSLHAAKPYHTHTYLYPDQLLLA